MHVAGITPLANRQTSLCAVVRDRKNGLASPSQAAQLEHHPTRQKAAGSISGQGTYPGFRFNPWAGRVWDETN